MGTRCAYLTCLIRSYHNHTFDEALCSQSQLFYIPYIFKVVTANVYDKQRYATQNKINKMRLPD